MTYLLVGDRGLPLNPLPAFAVAGAEVVLSSPFTASVTVTYLARVQARAFAAALQKLSNLEGPHSTSDLWTAYEAEREKERESQSDKPGGDDWVSRINGLR